MLCFPNIKINLGLYITEKRNDGYHNLETFFLPVNLYDALEIIPAANGISALSVSGLAVEGVIEQNIVWKAYLLIKNNFPDITPPFDIFLRKAIPTGAGLGGGSADGAFMLRLLNQYLSLNLSEEKLIDYALQLGSDCPFFIKNKPCVAKGRGEILQEIDLPRIYDYDLLLVCPQVHIRTASAFKHVTIEPPDINLRTIPTIDINDWKNVVVNKFEIPVFLMYPQLQEIKNKLYDYGAIYASLSGSGAALYGFFKQGQLEDIDLTIENATCHKIKNPFEVGKFG